MQYAEKTLPIGFFISFFSSFSSGKGRASNIYRLSYLYTSEKIKNDRCM